ncbi:PKD domain-containing protein [Pseudochryseolinea flava]|uniref:PKD domain-containing protein n=1 Tax=Pseudochryseolinea flava TaxID=2059302 RepID=A0A364Y174_9BACT|nr:PKD domain-containing protein [Pseudochryseolinea flava]RAW00573.1 hypothetical protein DQQ10_13315 [Pseudochryseolinea flava]
MRFLKFTKPLCRNLCGVLLILCGNIVFAQKKTNGFASSDYYSNYSPSTPEKSALGSFGNIPINYATGQPEINLNLFTLPSRDLSVPISLSYDASGVSVDDIASPAGLKWNLGAGGYVVRKLNGLPDEDPNKGYWKYKNELNANVIDPPLWTDRFERNKADAEPDEFFLYIPGRTIRFIIDNGAPVPIPRQALRMAYKVENGRITGFYLTTEDGTHYQFGLSPNAIEERKVETFHMVANFAFDWNNDTFVDYHDDVKQYDWFYLGDKLVVAKAHMSETINPTYTSKWYLIAITSTEGDAINFNYVKSGTTTYATQPVVTRKVPLLTSISNYTYEMDVCFRWMTIFDVPTCRDTRHHTIVRGEKVTKAYAGFTKACPDFDYSCSENFPQTVTQGQLNYFDPRTDRVDPEGIFVNQSIVTESLIRLENIKTSAGNQVVFYSSGRNDLPGAIKYDRITLVNMKNETIRNIKLNYSVVEANVANNFMWLSEAMVAVEKYGPDDDYEVHENATPLDASNFKSTPPNDQLLRKYVYEGMKEYNYNRLFLDGIVELSTTTLEHPLYSFVYYAREALPRRISPLQTVNGYMRSINYCTPEYLPVAGQFAFGNKVQMLHAYDPSSYRDPTYGSPCIARLIQIKYPTGGYTSLQGCNMLETIKDHDINGSIVAERSFVYTLKPISSYKPVLQSFENCWDENRSLYKRFKVMSSVPQNRSYREPSYFVDKVIVYNGASATDHNGYEVKTFSSHNAQINPVYSDPLDVNKDGNVILDLNRADVFPFLKLEEREHLSGLPLETTIYDKAGRKIKSTTNNYVVNPFGYQPPTLKGFIGGSFPYNGGKKIRYGRFSISADWILLDNVIEKVYDQSLNYDINKFVQSETKFHYDQIRKLTYPMSKVMSSNGTIIKTTFKYVSDDAFKFSENPSAGIHASSALKAILLLWEKNKFNTIIEERTSILRGGTEKLTSAKYNTFKIINGVAKPSEVYAFDGAINPKDFRSVYVTEHGDVVHDKTVLRKVHSYDEYDPVTRNLTKQTSIDGTTVSYVWDAQLANTVIKEEIVNPGTSQLRKQYDNRALVGPTSVTDANGVKTSFEYGEQGKLRLIRDHENNIKHRYRYHVVADNKNESFTATISVSGSLTVGWAVTISVNNETRSLNTTNVTYDYGDGQTLTTTAHSVTHIYTSPGAYVVTVAKSNPEYGTAKAQKTILINAALSVSICADGPVAGDVCRGIQGADVYGSCTAPANRHFSHPTQLKVNVVGNCNGAMTYRWEYRAAGSSTWATQGASQTITAPILPPGIGSGDVRCVAIDACGTSGISSIISFNFFRTCP